MIIKKILKIVAIILGVFILFWSVVIGLIATPEVITPRIIDIAQNHVKSEVSIKSVDLSLFTRFPNITLRIDSLRITQTRDSIDDLLFARQCRVAIDPVALLFKNVVVNHFSLRDASLYVYVDSLHGPLKTFILPESEETESTDSLSSFDLSDFTLSIKRFKIDSTQIVVDDRTRRFYTRIDNYNADVSLNLSSRQSNLDVVTGFSNLIVWNDGELLVKKTSLEVRSKMALDLDSLKLSFDRARLKLNGIDLKARGSLQRDSLTSGLLVDVRSSLNTPSLAEFLELIPPSVIDGKEKITTQGSVTLNLDINGIYSENSLPNIGALLKIEDAKAKYASRKLALEQVNCDAYTLINFNDPKQSYSHIKSLQINTSDIIDLNFSGKVTNIFDNPAVDVAVKSDIDFDRFTEVFPLNEAIICSGSNRSDLKAQFTLSDLQNSNFANLYINGESTFHDLGISVDASKFIQDSTMMAYLYLQAETGHMLFGDNIREESNSRTLRSKINFSGLGYKSKAGEYLTIKDIELTLGANFDRTTSRVNGVGVLGIAKNTSVGIDSLFSAQLESSELNLAIIPKIEEQEARIKASINSQQISANEPTYSSDITLSSVDMDLSMQRVAERQWDIDGSVAFSDFGMFTTLFPLEINVPETKVSVENKKIHLNNARLTLGSSELVATGYITNLINKLFIEPRAALTGELSINASFLNFSELMEATNSSVLMLDETEESSENEESSEITSLAPQVDSLSVASTSALFLVPRRMDFVFDLNIDKALFEEAIIEDVEGRATLKNGALSLEKLTLKAIGAEAAGELIYQNQGRTSANVAINMNVEGVDINRIGELLPSMNSMFPMLESFEGIVDFDFKANIDLDSLSMLNISTLRSAMMFKGKNLVLMDSETFADLSKTLMFKNKDRNLIDSIEAYALVEESTVDLLPFLMSIDRYQAVIGGSQVVDPETFDLNYDYNVSIIKSPLPFKAGVDISGDLNDFKFKITTAKLKNTNFDTQRSIYEEYRDEIKFEITTPSERSSRQRRRAEPTEQTEPTEVTEEEETKEMATEEEVAEILD